MLQVRVHAFVQLFSLAVVPTFVSGLVAVLRSYTSVDPSILSG